MKNKRFLILALFILTLIYACGPSLDGGENIDSKDTNGSLSNGLVFNPTDSIIPFPNDIKWSAPGTDHDGLVYFEISPEMSIGEQALYTALNTLKQPGFSPAAPIGIPLLNDVQLVNLEDKISLIDINAVQGFAATCMADPTTYKQCMANAYLTNYTVINQTARVKIVQDGNTIKLYPLVPLMPGHKYLVVIEDGIKDVNGTYLAEPALFPLIKGDTPLTGSVAGLEPIRLAYQKLWPILSLLQLTKDDVLEIFTFTTAAKYLSLTDLGLIANGMPQNVTGNTYDQIKAELDRVLSATYGVFIPNSLGGVNDTLKAIGAEPKVDNVNKTFVSYDFTTLTSIPKKLNVPFSVFVNNAADTNDVIIYQHGYLVNKSTGQVVLPNKGKYVVAMDLPYHGGRIDPNNPAFDCNQDGEVSDGECYITANIPADRINFIQSAFDENMFLNYLSRGMIDLDGDGTPDTVSKIEFVGVSMGSITGSMFLTHEDPANLGDNFAALGFKKVSKTVFNVSGAGLAAIFDTSKDMEAFVKSVLDSKGIEKNSAEYFGFLATLQWLADDADPIYQAGPTMSGPFLLQFAYKDSFVPNIANDIFATTMGMTQDYTFIDENTEITSGEPGKYMFRLSDLSPTPHAFLLYLLKGYPLSIKAQTQIGMFLQ